jgi:transcriptional regulator with XRE-family HTH domain
LINERFKILRQSLALSQEKFGERVGVYRSAILNIEHNKVIPKKVFVDHVCDVFNVNEDWLLSGIGNMFTGDMPDSDTVRVLIALCRRLRPDLQMIMLKHAEDYLDLQSRPGQVRYDLATQNLSSSVRVAETSELLPGPGPEIV